MARFDLDAVNNAADLDLYVYRLDAAGVPVALAGQSATASADESVTLTNPVKANYLVEIDGFSAAPGESGIGYRYDQFTVAATGGLGGLTATPNPVPVTQGQPTSFTASWSGLASGRYLGTFEYDGAPGADVRVRRRALTDRPTQTHRKRRGPLPLRRGPRRAVRARFGIPRGSR